MESRAKINLQNRKNVRVMQPLMVFQMRATLDQNNSLARDTFKMSGVMQTFQVRLTNKMCKWIFDKTSFLEEMV